MHQGVKGRAYLNGRHITRLQPGQQGAYTVVQQQRRCYRVLRLQADADACHAAKLVAFIAAASDTVVTQMHPRAIPVLEGMRDGHAGLHPKPA